MTVRDTSRRAGDRRARRWYRGGGRAGGARPALRDATLRIWRRVLPGRAERVVALALIVTFLLGAGPGWGVWEGWQARSDLAVMANLARELRDHLAAGQVDAARDTLSKLQRETSAARDRSNNLGWRIGRRTPGLSGNLAAVAAVTEVVDDFAHEGLPALVEVAADPELLELAPRDGRIDLTPLSRAAPGVAVVDEAIQRARDRVTAIPTDGLLPPLRTALMELRTDLDRAAAATRTAVWAAGFLPTMMGADGPRTYLVLFQNNAEVRATGGMPGAFAVMEADGGAIRIVDQGTAAGDLRVFEEPVLPLDQNLRALYTDRPAIFPANVNLTPHFPTAAQLAREMYRLRTGTTVDGVIATDPIALSYLLHATGPIALPEGAPLAAENAVQVLLSEVYKDEEGRRDYMALAALAAFEAVTGGDTDPRAAAVQLAQAAWERRILLWSADPEEQRLIADTVLGGELPTDDGLRPTVGVFLNDASGAKLGYYLTQSVELKPGRCRSDGRRELHLRVTLGSMVPPEGLPSYVLGLALADDPYTVLTNVSLFAPAGGMPLDVELDGTQPAVLQGIERGRAVGILTVALAPGETKTIEATLLTGVLPKDVPADLDLWLTPMVSPWEETVDSPSVC